MTRHFRSFLARITLCASAALPLSALAAPQMLVPYEGAVAKSEAPKEFKSEGSRVKFNLGALKSLKPGDEVELALPNGKRYTFVVDLYQEQGAGVSSWIGYHKESAEKLRAIITTGPGGSYGRIATPDGEYRLVPGPGHDWLVDMTAEQPFMPPIDLRNDTRIPPPQSKSLKQQMYSPEYLELVPGVNTVALPKATPAPVVVDLMVVHTNGLLAHLGSLNLNTRINNLVTAANTAYADSEVGITLRLVHTTMVTYTDTNGDDVALDDITPAFAGPSATFANIETLRSTYGADLVAFLRDGPSNGGSGIAWIANGPIGPGFAQYMYSVTTGCTALCDFVFIHELGHNMGNAHDRATSAWQSGGVAEPGSYSYSFGYYSCSGGSMALTCAAFGGACVSQPECNTPRSGTNNFADIMAYFHATTTRNLKFSNPAISCRGSLGISQACGVTAGQAEEADAARSMNNNRAALSALRPTAVPIGPPAATTLAVVSLLNPSFIGQDVRFRATVTSASGTPSGTVAFTADGVGIAGCSAVTLTTGVANCVTSALTAATHPINAVYSGSPTHAASAGNTDQVVNPALLNATITVISSVNPADTGVPVTFTATVSGSGGVPAGNLAFYDGSTIIPGCGLVTLSSGAGSCVTSALTAGTHLITVHYSASAVYNSGDSPTITQTTLTPPSGSDNVARASSGAVASASSINGPGLAASAAINGERAGLNWNSGSGWNDGTAGVWPDWLQVNFMGSRTIDRVVVYTLQDAWNAPSQPTDTMTFSLYGIQDFLVQGWNSGTSTWVTLATVTGNNLVKRSVTFPAYTTNQIRISVTRSLGMWSHITEVEAFTAAPAAASVNYALASAGGVATASSVYGSGLSASAAINGERAGLNWNAGSGWNDGTASAWPDWLQVNFTTARSIDRVVVYSLQDAYAAPSEPTDTMTFSLYGLQDFTVQGWNGSAWTTLATVVNNNLVKRTVTFAAVSTDRIRVTVTRSLSMWSHITELEAWGGGGAASPPPSTNVAAASAGASASASSVYGASLPAAAAINGDRAGLNWNAGSGWNDGTAGAWPDWLQVNFAAASTIDRVIVYALQDAYAAPSEPTDTMTFSLYGLQDFTVQGWNGSAWVTLATVTNNNLVKRTVTFAPTTTDRIRINVTRSLGLWSHITEVEAWTSGSTPPPTSSNVAAATAGGVASASSVYGASLPASAAINGDRAGMNWNAGSGWNDGTAGVWPDWLQVSFSGAKTIDRVVVYTLQDAYVTPAEPTDAMTFSLYGVQDFTVQGWNGSSWVTLGTVANNNLVKRTVTFTPFATDRIRINVTRALGLWSHITEVEAWGS